jgi:flagellar export protein FliJ
MPFRFSLHGILKLRRAQERVEELKLETILIRQKSLAARIENIAAAEFRIQRDRQERLLAGAAVAELQFLDVCATALVSARQPLLRQSAEIERERRSQLASLCDVRQKREILDSMRTRQCIEYELISGHREQQEHDDMFARRRLA